jgi:hypothetical protein
MPPKLHIYIDVIFEKLQIFKIQSGIHIGLKAMLMLGLF